MSEQLVEQANEQEEVAVVDRPSAAEQLRQVRESLGLSREEVAAELRLHLKLITALEENDRSQLPPTAFISGYLRAYAKLLGLPAEQLIAEYLNEGVAPASYRSTDRSGAQVVSSRDPKFRLISIGVAGGLLLLFGLWWANQRYDFVGATQGTAHTSENSAPEQMASSNTLPIPAPELRDPPQEEVTAETQGTAAEATAPAAMNGKPVQTTTNTNKSPATVVADTSATAAANSETNSEPLKVPPQMVKVTAEQLPAGTPQATIRLEYQAASWTQITDAKGRVLSYDLVNPGRTLEVHGVAPFKVFLGYAPGVLLYYNGTLFSHAAYHRGDLAKFTVGTAQDNKPLDR